MTILCRNVIRRVTSIGKRRSQMNHQQGAKVVNLPEGRMQKDLILVTNLLVKRPIKVKIENLTRLHQAELRRDHHQKYPIIPLVSYYSMLSNRMVNMETNQQLQLNRRLGYPRTLQCKRRTPCTELGIIVTQWLLLNPISPNSV